MPLLKNPKTITPETVLHMTRLTDDPRIADDHAMREQLLEQREGILMAMRQRKAVAIDERRADRHELREMVTTVDDDDDDAWTPDISKDGELLALQAHLETVDAELLVRKRRIEAMAQVIRNDILQAGATAQLHDLDAILRLLREAKALAQVAAQRSQRLYGLVQDFCGPVKVLTALSVYDLSQWEADLPRLRRLAEGKHRG